MKDWILWKLLHSFDCQLLYNFFSGNFRLTLSCLAMQSASKEQSASKSTKELVPLNEAGEMPLQEEMVLDPRTQGIEVGQKSGRSLGLQF